MVDGSRAPCLLPPYTPTDASRLADGTPIRRDADGRQWIISLQGEHVPSPEEASALVERVRGRGGELAFLSFGLYCRDQLCFSYEGNLCEVRVEELARTLMSAIAEDPILPRPRAELSIALVGDLGPRCAETDENCGPIPYDSGMRYDASRGRELGPLPQYSAGECTHDGDCIVKGCGNHCVGWQYFGAREAATCEGYSFTEPVFCGCVAAECGWFTQR